MTFAEAVKTLKYFEAETDKSGQAAHRAQAEAVLLAEVAALRGELSAAIATLEIYAQESQNAGEGIMATKLWDEINSHRDVFDRTKL